MKNRAFLHQPGAQHARIGEIAVVRDGDAATRKIGKQGGCCVPQIRPPSNSDLWPMAKEPFRFLGVRAVLCRKCRRPGPNGARPRNWPLS